VRTIWSPARALLGRLRYGQKILLVTLVLLLPLGFVVYAYVDIQRGQVAFSAKERDGVAYARPLAELTLRAVTARHLAVSGGDPAAAAVAAAVPAVDAATDRYGAELGTAAGWASAKAQLAAAAATSTPAAAYPAYNAATATLLALIVQTSDKSNLTLDPDLDSYYVMDAVMFRLPILLDMSGQAADLALLARPGSARTQDTARIDLAIASGTLASTLAAVDGGLATSFQATASATLPAAGQPELAAVHGAVSTLLAQVTSAVRTGNLALVSSAQGERTRAAVAALAGALTPELDALLATRIGGFQAKAHRIELITALALLLVAYLVGGFYASAIPPLRRILTVLAGLAGGDLTRTIVVGTRDEVGQMGTALNSAMQNMRTVMLAIEVSAGNAAASASALTEVSAELHGAAQGSSRQAGTVSDAAVQVTREVTALGASTDEMSTSIRDIAVGAGDATAVAAEAVAAAGVASETVGRLGRSTAEIGEVLKAITAIAAQTNLLALNATIEAARAGASGRGFAVVANEVKDLAQETARATADISRRIATIAADTGAAVQAIGGIEAVIGRISDSQSSITDAVRTQTATVAEMGRNFSQLAGAAQEITDGVTGVADSTRATSTVAGDTLRAAENLSGTAAELREIVARFRTG